VKMIIAIPAAPRARPDFSTSLLLSKKLRKEYNNVARGRVP
jgi:hypothetical protein